VQRSTGWWTFIEAFIEPGVGNPDSILQRTPEVWTGVEREKEMGKLNNFSSLHLQLRLLSNQGAH
jgi:hypothetical protein